MERPLTELFLRARDQHVATGRRALLAVVALFVAHAAMVTPWVERDRARVFARAEAERFAAAGEVAELRAGLESSLADLGSHLEPALARLAENVETDLQRLDATVEELAVYGGDDGPASAGRPGEAAFEIDRPEWLAALRDAVADGSRYGLLAALDPIVEALIVRKRFGELRRAWNDDLRPRVEPVLDRTAAAIPRLRRLLPEAEDPWAALEGALTGLRATLQEIELGPPAEPYWWAAPEVAAAAPGSGLGLTAATAEQLRQPLALDELQTAAGRVRERFRELGDRLDSVRREVLGTAPGEGGGAGFAALLAGLGFDLHTVTVYFPLLLGLALAALTLRRDQRLRELGLCARPLLAGGGSGDLRTWCLAQVGGDGDADLARRRGALRALGVLTLALAWIAAAALQVHRLSGIDERRWLITGAAGAALVVLATVHRLLAARRFVTLLAEEEPRPSSPAFGGPWSAGDDLPSAGRDRPAPAPDSGLADTGAGGETRDPILDGHTLRR